MGLIELTRVGFGLCSGYGFVSLMPLPPEFPFMPPLLLTPGQPPENPLLYCRPTGQHRLPSPSFARPEHRVRVLGCEGFGCEWWLQFGHHGRVIGRVRPSQPLSPSACLPPFRSIAPSWLGVGFNFF